jgi:tetratricopeptide (TPR) repeat protein
MVKNKTEEQVDGLETVEGALTRTERYIEENQKSLTIIIAAIIIIVGGYLAYQKLYVAPKEKEAIKEMFVAEQYFAKDSFNLALNGDNNYPGFLSIIDDYGVTKVGNLSNYYAGVCYLRMGQYEKAIEYLEDYELEDKMIAPIAIGAIGDCYMELGKDNEALSNYLKAADYNENEFTAPIYLLKAALTYEKLNNYNKAIEIYEKIERKYNKSAEARKVEKYLVRAKLRAGK